MEVTRHFTTATFVVFNNKVLLHKHRKLGFWLPVGGHIDRDEIPEAAAMREVQEECGLNVSFYWPETGLRFADGIAEELIRPVHILLEDINQFHQHIDFIYYAKSSSPDFVPEDPDGEMKWISEEEIDELEAPDNVKILAKEALEVFKK